jgi:pyruvate dehydrogenase E2 component (dihydrolipoamide acetyltransferase)
VSADVDRNPGAGPVTSPSAKRLADELGVDITAVRGSGPGGRIVRSDVEAAASRPTTHDTPNPGHTGSNASTTSGGQRIDLAKGEVTVVAPSRIQRAVARRMADSRATVPDFSLVAEVDMEACLAARQELKRRSTGSVPSINDIIVKACALALREHPRANGAYCDGQFEFYSRVNVGIAVASTDALIVPTIFDADLKPLSEVAAEARELAERARAATVSPAELAGGTFTISNLGMFGIRRFTAVVNPPQAAILAVGETVSRMRVIDERPASRRVMDVTLTCDHRILYGADAARFLQRIRAVLEQPPESMLA